MRPLKLEMLAPRTGISWLTTDWDIGTLRALDRKDGGDETARLHCGAGERGSVARYTIRIAMRHE
jgi:hypothetical protein